MKDQLFKNKPELNLVIEIIRLFGLEGFDDIQEISWRRLHRSSDTNKGCERYSSHTSMFRMRQEYGDDTCTIL